jgi:hypothetical protein
MVLQMAGQYAASTACFEEAKKIAQELWTQSVGANAAAWMTTDNALPYQGEDFEKVFIHLATAINYLSLGAHSEARVEARQVTNRLALYNTKYGKNASCYRDDGFARWLSGRLSEDDTQDPQGLSDAWIDYRMALQIYEEDYLPRYGTAVPSVLVADAVRVLRRLGKEHAADLEKVLKRYPAAKAPDPVEAKQADGHVILVYFSGEAPYKRSRYWQAPVVDTVVRVAYPEFVAKPALFAGAVLRHRDSGQVVRSEKMEDVAAIAVRNLEDRMGRIRGKAIARAVGKFAAAHAVQKGGTYAEGTAGGVLYATGALLKISSLLMEEADNRSWVTLPASVHVAEMALPAGDHTLDLELVTAMEAVMVRQTVKVSVEPGRATFLTLRSLD